MSVGTLPISKIIWNSWVSLKILIDTQVLPALILPNATCGL